ncbi:MAG: FAD-dependent oxidoreductase, partial [Rhodoferax sp.]|nr:FAD-dependent oxidoreductase [Rhodoferax sp.]
MALWVWGFGFYDIFFEFDIPFRCLLPKGLNNLLLGSRCISVSYDAFGPIRMQPTIMQVGETAGR